MPWTASVIATRTVNRNVDDPTISITTVAGDGLLVVPIYVKDTSEGTVSSVADGGSDVYNQDLNYANVNQSIFMYSIDGPTAEAKTITVTTSAATDTVIVAMSFQGTSASPLVGDTASNGSAGTTLSTSGGDSMVASNDNSVIISMFGLLTNASEGGSTFGTGQVLIDDGSNGGAEKFYACGTYELNTATGTNEQSITFDASSTSIVGAVEYIHETFVATPLSFQVI